ncbi:protein DpdH [Streptomyces sp. NPDC059679]|uniref:protein DpdH n=1 Tax=Streptomyces sp. NPDC059679 TaxID=3346903 RepID=UPI00367423C5
MSDFRRYVCWEAATAANTIDTEAIAPSPAVFKATHAPLRIRRAGLDGRQLILEDEQFDERAVLQDFLHHESNTGALLVPVVGESGSGKSHLVRWVREHLVEFDDQSASREVIYLEKHKTSLKAVIQALIARADSDELTQLKSEIDRFTSDVDAPVLARRLVHSLNEILVTETGNGVSGPARQLFGPHGLGALLDDPHVSEYMLRPDKFLPQLANYLLRDRRKGDSDRPPKFTLDDLPLDITDVTKASALAKKWVQVLSSRTELQEVAIDLLNRHLESAINRSFNLGAGRLLEAMTLVRREYQKQGKEIVLLIEDFALIQGVQKELLDALVEAARREGSARLAPIRTLMAVTTGYFRALPETVLTRVRATLGYVYDLDVPFSAEDTGDDQIAAFVGRYLNAARLGTDRLEQATDGTVPNACEDCPLQVECHQAFGTSADGFGLYPFNKPALRRAVHSTASKRDPWAFVPRTVLGSVIRPVLIEHVTALRRGEFPDATFREEFETAAIDNTLTSDVAAYVGKTDPSTAERRKLVLEFWGDAAEQSVEIDPTILDAFALTPLKTRELPSTKALPEIPKTPTRITPSITVSGEEALPASVQRSLQNIEEWSQRRLDLHQSYALSIRTIVATAVSQRYRWNVPLMQPQRGVKDKGWPNNAKTVSIEGTAVSGLAGADNAPIKFNRTPTNSRFFQSLIRAQAGVAQVRGEDIRKLATVAERHAGALATRVQQSLHVTDEDLILGLRASLLGAALAGRSWPGMRIEDLLAAAVDDGTEWRSTDVMARPDPWAKALNDHRNARRQLVDRIRTGLGISQGASGAVKMIDAARAVPLLEEAAADWSWTAPTSKLADWIKPAVASFRAWPALIEGQINALQALLDDIRLRQPRGVPGRHTLASVRTALDRAREQRLSLPTQRARDFDKLLERATAADWSKVSALEDDLDRATSAEESGKSGWVAAIRAAAQERGSSLHVIREFLCEFDEWLDEAMKGAEMRASSSAAQSAAARVQEVIEEWRSLAIEGRN